jgi:hypothetical protein
LHHHTQEISFVDASIGTDRRLDWCKKINQAVEYINFNPESDLYILDPLESHSREQVKGHNPNQNPKTKIASSQTTYQSLHPNRSSQS